MQTEALREFILLCEYGNVSQTARELFMARSTLASHMRELEKEVGVLLFSAGNLGQPTEAGYLLLDYARSIVKDCDAALSVCRQAGALSLSDAPTALRVAYAGATSAILARIRTLSPVPLSLVHVNPKQPFFSLFQNDGPCDLQFQWDFSNVAPLVEEAQHLDLTWVRVGIYPNWLCVSKTSKLGTCEDVSLSDLQGLTFAGIVPGFYRMQKHVIETMFGSTLDYKVKLLQSVEDVESFISFELEDDVLLVSNSAQTRSVLEARDDVRFIERIDGKPFGYPQALLFRRGAREHNPQLAAFVDAVVRDADANGGWIWTDWTRGA